MLRVEDSNKVSECLKFKGKFMKTIFKCQKKRCVLLTHEIFGCVCACLEEKDLIKCLPEYIQTFLMYVCVCVCVKIFRKLARGFN